MDEGLRDELGLTGTPHPLSLKWTGGVTREEDNSERLQIRLCGYDESPTDELTHVHTVKQLALPAQSVDVVQLAAKYPHLRGLPVRPYSRAVPRILIGADNCHLGQPLKTVKGKHGEPVAWNTSLGWVIYGPCDGRDDQHATSMKTSSCSRQRTTPKAGQQ
uniref:Peptidase aspartic putative domain-containing protein n=1 Tax=Anopheles gambiae TaxID=7165 RepID=A0A0E4C7D8_ANOGA